MQATELMQKLNQPMGSTEEAVAHAIGIYKEAAALQKALKEVQAQAKKQLEEIIIETGQDKWDTDFGKCYITKPSVSVRYDPKALDALCASNEQIAAWLQPHRKESERAGTLTVR